MTIFHRQQSTPEEQAALSPRELIRLREAEAASTTRINGENFWGMVKRVMAEAALKEFARKLNRGLKVCRRSGATAEEILAHDRRQKTGRPKKQNPENIS